MPCRAGKCPAHDARGRLDAGKFQPEERAGLEEAAKVCEGDQPDPWDPGLKWSGCPAKAAISHPDVADALLVRGLSRLHPLANWPRGWSARVVEAWAMLEAEEAALREAAR